MSLGYRLERIDHTQRHIVESLWQMYRHDMSEFTDSHPGADGRFKLGRLPGYFENSTRGWLIYGPTDQLAGFAFINEPDLGPRSMGDFFILRRWRRGGLASAVAMDLIRSNPGAWEIAFQLTNTGAAHLWRSIAEHIQPGQWQEELRPVPGKPHIAPDAWISFTCE